MYKKTLIKITTFVALISAIMINGCSHTSTPVKKPTIPEVTLPSVYDEYETETNSEGEIVVIVPSTDENGSTEYITEIATDEAGENITVPPTTEAPTEPETKPAPENQTTEPVTEPSGEDMTEAPTQKPTTKPTEANKETGTTKPTSKPTQTPTTEPQTTKPTQAPTVKPTEAPTQKPTQAPTEKPTVKPTETPTQKPTEAPTVKPTEPPTTAPVVKDRVIKTTDADYAKYSNAVKQKVESKYGFTVYTTGEWVYYYHITTGELFLLSYVGNSKTVTVPTAIHGNEITWLSQVFEDNTTVENVIIPANNNIKSYINVFNNASALKTIRIGHQGALEASSSATFTVKTPEISTKDNSVHVYCDEDFTKKMARSMGGNLTIGSCTFVITMNDGKIRYDHFTYDLYGKDCGHEYHFWDYKNDKQYT